MLSYQHGFHAGNRADVLKHAVLHSVLTELRSANKSIFYVETHAGRGVYDLGSEQAVKTGEAAEGVLAMLEAPPAPKPLQPCLLYTSPSPRDLSTSRMPSSA